MKRKIFVTALLVCSAVICFAIAGISGKWSGTIKTDQGVEPITYTFQADGAKLTGNVLYNANTLNITDGVIKGDSLKFNVDYGGNPIAHVGRVYADSITLDVTIDPNIVHINLKKNP
jgi:hypothetical protein